MPGKASRPIPPALLCARVCIIFVSMTLRTRVLTATFWLSAGSVLSQAISYGSTLLLAGLLSPQEMGKAAIGMLIVSSVGLLREMGIGRALIYMKDPVDDAADTGFILIPLVSVSLYVVVALCAGLAAAVFRDPDVAPLVRVMALALVINAFGEIPSSLLEKRLAFDRKTVTEISGLASYGVLVVVLAYAGLSFWSIAYASLASSALSVLVTWRLSDWRPRLSFSPGLARELLRYGRRIVESTAVNFGIRNLDNAIVGRMIGPAALGAYDFAYRIANIPATTITPVIGKVMFPVYTQLSEYAYDLRNAFLKALKFIAILTVPVSVELYLLAPGAIAYAYGVKWQSAIRPIQILTLYGLIRSLSSGQGGIFMALNRVRTMTKVSSGQFVLLLVLLYPVARVYGLAGVCWVSVIAMAYSAVTHFILMCPLIQLRPRQIAVTLGPSLVCTVLAAGAAEVICRQIVHPATLAFLILQPLITATLYLPLIALDPDVRQVARDLTGRVWGTAGRAPTAAPDG